MIKNLVVTPMTMVLKHHKERKVNKSGKGKAFIQKNDKISHHSLSLSNVKKYRCKFMCSAHNSNEMVEMSKVIGNAIIAFTAIYCSLNWSFYRNIRKQIEKERNNDENNEVTDDTDKKKKE